MEIIGRDKITQTGDHPSVKISNSALEADQHWYQKWWGKFILGLLAAVLAGAVLYFVGWN